MARLLFIVGVVVALAVSLWARGGIFPWILGAFGIVVGILFWKERTAGVLIATIALVVALSAILQQPLNPEWLSHLVFFVRLFVAHVALPPGALAIFVPHAPQRVP